MRSITTTILLSNLAAYACGIPDPLLLCCSRLPKSRRSRAAIRARRSTTISSAEARPPRRRVRARGPRAERQVLPDRRVHPLHLRCAQPLHGRLHAYRLLWLRRHQRCGLLPHGLRGQSVGEGGPGRRWEQVPVPRAWRFGAAPTAASSSTTRAHMTGASPTPRTSRARSRGCAVRRMRPRPRATTARRAVAIRAARGWRGSHTLGAYCMPCGTGNVWNGPDGTGTSDEQYRWHVGSAGELGARVAGLRRVRSVR